MTLENPPSPPDCEASPKRHHRLVLGDAPAAADARCGYSLERKVCTTFIATLALKVTRACQSCTPL